MDVQRAFIISSRNVPVSDWKRRARASIFGKSLPSFDPGVNALPHVVLPQMILTTSRRQCYRRPS
jgi:hypothetical protein